MTRLICPACHRQVTNNFRALAPGFRLLPYPVAIHFCPTVQPPSANDLRPAATPLPDAPAASPPRASIFSLVTP